MVLENSASSWVKVRSSPFNKRIKCRAITTSKGIFLLGGHAAEDSSCKILHQVDFYDPIKDDWKVAEWKLPGEISDYYRFAAIMMNDRLYVLSASNIPNRSNCWSRSMTFPSDWFQHPDLSYQVTNSNVVIL